MNMCKKCHAVYPGMKTDLCDDCNPVAKRKATPKVSQSEMENAILSFADGQSWAAQSWKNMAHVAPLFEIAEAIKTTQKQDNRT